MNIQIKKAVKAGNSSAVIVPRAWLDKKVRVELIKKNPETILADTISIIKRYIDLKEVIGIYLVGSYARGEEDENSDIDVLVITANTDKEMIKDGIYNILIVSSELLNQKLIYNLFPIGQMIKEAKPLINSKYLDSIEVKVTRKNVKWYVDTTKDKLEIIKKILDKAKSKITNKKNKKGYINDRIAYTLILRIRTLYIIEKLIKNQDYSKKEFEKLIKKISKGTKAEAYESYLSVKNNLYEGKGISIIETEHLFKYLKSQLTNVKNMLEKLKKKKKTKNLKRKKRI